ncbi:MAG: ABC transporter ATP-binding protein [Bacteroidales bacterium]|jgi:iron complex transport system ATP-binding protein|nr:ABC transporter ATP-binding protein [Bacteroidales bacterium]
MITLSGVQFAYNGFPVIKGITHSFVKGSFTALLGPNGSGKSTLIRLINGILTPQAGTVEVMGRSAGSISAREMAREMAYVPQMQYNTFPATVFDTVLLGRNPYISWSPGKDDRRITAEILVRLGLDDIALKDLNKLSGGQRQQVFIARALAQQPSVILLDEPTANLDLRHQHEILRLLGELAAGGITVLVAIHDLNLALKYCNEFMILDDGQVSAEGRREIFSEKLIEDIYGVRIKIIRHEGEMYIIPTEPL